MDLLGFFKGKICFLKLKYVKTFPYTDPAARDPRIASAAWHHVARARLARHWLPHGIRPGAVRPGTVQASMWPWTGVVSRSGSWRIGCGYAGMWPHVHRPTRAYNSDPRCSTKCLQGRRRREMTSPAAGPTAPGRLAKTGRLLGTPLGCWARRAQDRGWWSSQ
jgi:hypothetical protein